MGSLDFEGRKVRFEEGDTVASALFRAGVRTFTRSTKYHRRRGLYCVSGDCPNCPCTVDGVPAARACTTEPQDGMKVQRESGVPSADRDLLSVLDRAHGLMPVGFYYKVFAKPAFAWKLAERFIRRATGIGTLPRARVPQPKPSRFVHADVLVVGGGVAGLAAAIAAAGRGERVVLCDEARIGEKLAPGPARERVWALHEEATAAGIEVLERHTAIGVYEGPLVPVVGPSELLQVRPSRVIVATGAIESHAVFRGSDLPGVWLGRGAARMAGVHGVKPGERAVVATETAEGIEHLATLRAAGVAIAAVVVPQELAERVPGIAPTVGRVIAAEGRKHLRAVVVEGAGGRRKVECDALVVSLGWSPRDALLRMDPDVAGAGDVVLPGCTLQEAEESGRLAGSGGGTRDQREPHAAPLGEHGYVCLCEDVSVGDLEQAWREGWRSSEILKRYTTATMGPCQGAMCGRHLSRFVAERGGAGPQAGALTTARPPARSVRLEELIGGVNEIIEKRTALHERHLQMGAKLAWSGSWKRPYNYGDWKDEYRAVRERVSLMDVGTLGKFLVAGRDARELLDRVFPCRIVDLAPGRGRYLLALDEAGYVMDDGLVSAIEDGRYYLTSTSGGSDRMEAWLRNWADRFDLHVHLVNQTAMLGAINVAGPRARDLLQRLSEDDLGPEAVPYAGNAEVTVAGVPCRAVRAGFVGELAFELHHSRSRSVELWDALLEAGSDLGIRPHGLDALELLRLEKGHIYLGQDTLPDDHPTKLGLGWAVAMAKGPFIGRAALERMAALPLERKLIGLEFDGDGPERGVPLYAGERVLGRVTSVMRSPALGAAIGLGWLRALDGEFPASLRAGQVGARVVPTPFYDPEGARLRA